MTWSNLIDTLSSNPLVGYLTSAYAICVSVVAKVGDMEASGLNEMLRQASLVVGVLVGLTTFILQIFKIHDWWVSRK